MTALYLDSSALVKLYLTENPAQRQTVLDALEKHDGRAVISVIGYAEVASALARYFHEGRLDEEEHHRDMDILQNDWESVNTVDVLPEISVRAGQLLKAQRGLRAMDALHLASALSVRTVEEVEFLTFDTQIKTIARKLMPEAVT